eukprot:c6090_g1_i1.p2 GENE.c6090_g1_i1~~c6090_g1_i1.p2  ORF type:complete len:159 (+),score=12.57 c6090_g1_i1:829-1305(+)
MPSTVKKRGYSLLGKIGFASSATKRLILSAPEFSHLHDSIQCIQHNRIYSSNLRIWLTASNKKPHNVACFVAFRSYTTEVCQGKVHSLFDVVNVSHVVVIQLFHPANTPKCTGIEKYCSRVMLSKRFEAVPMDRIDRLPHVQPNFENRNSFFVNEFVY